MSRLTKLLRTQFRPSRKSRGAHVDALALRAGNKMGVDAQSTQQSNSAGFSGLSEANNRFDEYFIGKDLTTDWTTHNFGSWVKILEPKRKNAWRILEIGSFEGRSALFFLNYLPAASIVCVDTFSGNPEHRDTASRHAASMTDVERRFDKNLASFGMRVEKRKGDSMSVLPRLAFEQRLFDLIYVDGDHRAASAYLDAALSWPLLVAGGVMIFDDYQWELDRAPDDRPQLGIDSFVLAMIGRLRQLHRGYQLIVEKF